ncbi:DUF975 family protein [Enterococcus faecalis]|uniref:DUF975 family protein n=1 Tax=Enterococcus faecalis TaxID=1351 RepID=UPI001F473DEC|nr:DUF975 family protein [Enterococcus faecalis]BDC77748.1 membrane protein [Enterococcus faecalis]
MKTSKELKQLAKNNLHGRWGQAVLLNIIPTLITVIGILVVFFSKIFFDFNNVNHAISLRELINYATNNSDNWAMNIISGIISALFMSGISWTYLDILRKKRSSIKPFKDAFRGFRVLVIWNIVLLTLVIMVFTSLWSLLFIIPGIIKSYSYSQSYFIYYDIVIQTGKKPKVLDVITSSKELMNGYKWNLFWLNLTFIGWHILSILTLGIGYLWLNPYICATEAAFYNELSKDILGNRLMDENKEN